MYMVEVWGSSLASEAGKYIYIYIYGTLPPMYPHFCGILIINLEVKTCFHVLVSDVILIINLEVKTCFHVLVSDVQGGYHIYIYILKNILLVSIFFLKF